MKLNSLYEKYKTNYGIELHTVKPELVAENLGKTAATAYDLTHGYSDQYILEIEKFMSVIQEVGLTPDGSKFRKFPNSDFATVSVSLFYNFILS